MYTLYMDFFLLFSFPLSDLHISGRALLYVSLVNILYYYLCVNPLYRKKIANLTLRAFFGLHLRTGVVLHEYSSLGKTRRPTTKTVGSEVSLKVLLYCATSWVDLLARRFRLASNRYIVLENTKAKTFQYQVTLSIGLFEETNKQHIFSKVFYN